MRSGAKAPTDPAIGAKDDTLRLGPASVDYPFLGAPQAAGEIGRLAEYRVLRLLGSGGMGLVFLAEDTKLRRLTALNWPSSRPWPRTRATAAAFWPRPRRWRPSRTENVVAVFQVSEDRGTPFLAMQYLQGETLHARLKREKKLPVADAVRIGVREVALGLAAAHDHEWSTATSNPETCSCSFAAPSGARRAADRNRAYRAATPTPHSTPRTRCASGQTAPTSGLLALSRARPGCRNSGQSSAPLRTWPPNRSTAGP